MSGQVILQSIDPARQIGRRFRAWLARCGYRPERHYMRGARHAG